MTCRRFSDLARALAGGSSRPSIFADFCTLRVDRTGLRQKVFCYQNRHFAPRRNFCEYFEGRKACLHPRRPINTMSERPDRGRVGLHRSQYNRQLGSFVCKAFIPFPHLLSLPPRCRLDGKFSFARVVLKVLISARSYSSHSLKSPVLSSVLSNTRHSLRRRILTANLTAMFKFISLATLALSAVASVSGAAIPRDEASYDQPVLEVRVPSRSPFKQRSHTPHSLTSSTTLVTTPSVALSSTARSFSTIAATP